MSLPTHAVRVFCLVLLPFIFAGSAVRAEEFEQHAAHEHGKVTLNVAVDAGLLVFELDSPAVNVVGFEHTPATDSERNAVRAASDLFKDGRKLFGLPAEAACAFEQADVKAPQWEQAARKRGEHESHEEHADYEARFTYRCATPAALGWFEPWVLDQLRNVLEARVNIVTATGQLSVVVKSGHTRVSFR